MEKLILDIVSDYNISHGNNNAVSDHIKGIRRLDELGFKELADKVVKVLMVK